MRKILFTTTLFALLALGTACSSSGGSVSRRVIAPKTINPPTQVNPEVAPYLPRFVAAVERLGFRVARTDDPEALQMKLDFNPNVMNMRVSVSLWQAGTPIVTAGATNSGWGTAIARGSALGNLIDSAAKAFETELRKISSALQITADRESITVEALPAGEVTIESDVPNADVFVDGKFVGNTPLHAYKLPLGDHEIQIVAAGYMRWKRTLTVVGGTSTRVAATLRTPNP